MGRNDVLLVRGLAAVARGRVTPSPCLHQAVEKPSKVLKQAGQKLKMQKVVIAALGEYRRQLDDGVSQAEIVQWWTRAKFEVNRRKDEVSPAQMHTCAHEPLVILAPSVH